MTPTPLVLRATLQDVIDEFAESGLTPGQAWVRWRGDTVFSFTRTGDRRTDRTIIVYETMFNGGGIYERRCALSGRCA